MGQSNRTHMYGWETATLKKLLTGLQTSWVLVRMQCTRKGDVFSDLVPCDFSGMALFAAIIITPTHQTSLLIFCNGSLVLGTFFVVFAMMLVFVVALLRDCCHERAPGSEIREGLSVRCVFSLPPLDLSIHLLEHRIDYYTSSPLKNVTTHRFNLIWFSFWSLWCGIWSTAKSPCFTLRCERAIGIVCVRIGIPWECL